MKDNEFYANILRAINDNITVIDSNANIQYTNHQYTFLNPIKTDKHLSKLNKINFLDECNRAELLGDEFSNYAKRGIRSILDGECDHFYLEYPRQTSVEKKWYSMRVTPFSMLDSNFFVITEQDISSRKLAQEKAEILARTDALTGIANRRYFDEFLNRELKRCRRNKHDISLLMLDLDHFKIFNDTYGHQAGDQCLKQIADLLAEFSNRPSDLCARYGGEEFVLIWGNMPRSKAYPLAKRLLERIIQLQIPHINSPVNSIMTASIGLCSNSFLSQTSAEQIIQIADRHLYEAKQQGRCRIAPSC